MSDLTACLHAVTATISRVEQENRVVNQYTARDFTPFRFMRQGEVPTTHLLAFFLNLNEDHGQGPLFQELFLARLRKALPNEGSRLPAAHWDVEAERRHVGYGQLDLLLTTLDKRFGICIENKPRDQTIDQPNQLNSYRALLQERHQENYLLIYLSSVNRPPGKVSIEPDKREKLTSTGQYVNLTYRDFILPLLDDWHQAVPPESLRTFLRQFRYHIEQWMQFESTKPAKLNLTQQIVSTLISTPEYVRAAFNIADSLTEMKRQLLTDLIAGLKQNLPDLEVRMHWKYAGFLDGINRKALLLRPPSIGESPTSFRWGRSAIAIEFDNDKKLFYGVRFDKVDLVEGDNQGHPWREGAPVALAKSLETQTREWESWLWWDWVGPENDVELYLKLADGTLLAELVPKIEKIKAELDKDCFNN